MHAKTFTGRIGRKLLTTCLITGAIAASPHFSVSSDTLEPIGKTLNWLGDYGEALKAAVAAQRPVWVQFTGPWCPNCHKMDKETFRNPRVIERLSRHFVTAKISCENDAELALSFGFTQLPSSVLISPDGKILARHEGFADPDQLESLTLAAGVPAESKTAPIGENTATGLASNAAETTTIEADLISTPTGQVRETFEVAMLEPVDDTLPRISIATDEAPGAEAGEIVEPEKPSDATAKSVAESLPPDPSAPLGQLCPVTLLEKAILVESGNEHTAVYAGSRYYFESAGAKARFAAEPEKYVPARGGECLVTLAETKQEVAGSERFPVVYDGRIYLCASEPARQKFLADPATYASRDLRSTGACPHCGASLASQQHNRNRFQIRFGGSRYQFPDKAHMEAFLKAPLRYLR